MASIQQSPFPLAFPVSNADEVGSSNASPKDAISIRTFTRSMEGMQKEALVHNLKTGVAWRMVCDEGPYLNGTDLAPFPLAYFCSGMVASYMSEILALLKQRNIHYDNITLSQDNRYTMSGSAIQGTMIGGALPVELTLELDSDAEPAIIKQVMSDAVAASPAGALLNNILVSEFSITLNGKALATDRVQALPDSVPAAPANFDQLAPNEELNYPGNIVTKGKATETFTNVAGGAGTSLSDNQKRTLHMRGICTLRDDGLKSIQVQLFQPIGSQFFFLSDDSKELGGQERAPSGLAYLSAGLAFCYMTQLGRYAHIVKKPLDLYRVIQDTGFSLPGASGGTSKAATAAPVKTHVYVDTSENEDYVQTLVDMSEQTCFLHAACREVVKVKIKQS